MKPSRFPGMEGLKIQEMVMKTTSIPFARIMCQYIHIDSHYFNQSPQLMPGRWRISPSQRKRAVSSPVSANRS